MDRIEMIERRMRRVENEPWDRESIRVMLAYTTDNDICLDNGDFADVPKEDAAEFIAEAVEDIKFLLARIRRLEKESKWFFDRLDFESNCDDCPYDDEPEGGCRACGERRWRGYMEEEIGKCET